MTAGRFKAQIVLCATGIFRWVTFSRTSPRSSRRNRGGTTINGGFFAAFQCKVLVRLLSSQRLLYVVDRYYLQVSETLTTTELQMTTTWRPSAG